MKFVIIGAGNVATHFGMALLKTSHDILQVMSRTSSSANALADKLGASAVTDIEEVCTDADVYLISVKDDAISGIAEKLKHRISSDALIVHTAGSVSIDVLREHCENCAVIYPMQTFSKVRMLDFHSVPCFVEGSNDAVLKVALNIASGISDKVQVMDSAKRKYMHLAAVFACNMVNHCYRLAEQIVESQGIDFDLFMPLIEETAKKVKEMKPADAQTGPMVRNDHTVMDAQKVLLDDDRKRRIYELMAESIYEDTLAKRS